jgi:sugar (pentulose or hexulose) kinase
MKELCEATRYLQEYNADLFQSVMGMVMVAFRDSSVILDENKKPIRPAILWLDQRVTVLPHMNNLKAGEKLLFGVIGMTDTVKYNAERTPSFWLMKNEPENWQRMRYYVPLTAYFNYRVTGKLIISSADAIGHFPINFKKGKWLPAIHPKIDVFGIPLKSLPPLVKCGSELGKVSKDFSVLSGIEAGLPIYASGSDKACETFGNGCSDKTTASISLGTACTIDVVDSRYSEPETFLPSYQAPYPGDYDLEVQIYRGLWMIKWFTEEFGQVDKAEAAKAGLSVEEYLNQQITKIPAGSDGLVLQPYWGPGLKRPNAKGSIIGFSAVHTRYHLYRAIFEGIAFALREGLDEIEKKTHRKPDHLIVSGGGSASDIFCHIIADVFGIPVERSTSVQSSTRGAAMAGFLDAGVFPTAADAIHHMVKEGERFEPDEKNHELYEKLYKKVYVKLYPSLRQVYENCKHFYLQSNGEEK